MYCVYYYNLYAMANETKVHCSFSYWVPLINIRLLLPIILMLILLLLLLLLRPPKELLALGVVVASTCTTLVGYWS